MEDVSFSVSSSFRSLSLTKRKEARDERKRYVVTTCAAFELKSLSGLSIFFSYEPKHC